MSFPALNDLKVGDISQDHNDGNHNDGGQPKEDILALKDADLLCKLRDVIVKCGATKSTDAELQASPVFKEFRRRNIQLYDVCGGAEAISLGDLLSDADDLTFLGYQLFCHAVATDAKTTQDMNTLALSLFDGFISTKERFDLLWNVLQLLPRDVILSYRDSDGCSLLFKIYASPDDPNLLESGYTSKLFKWFDALGFDFTAPCANIEAGVDGTPNIGGETLLDMAVHHYDVESVDFLLSKGCKFDLSYHEFARGLPYVQRNIYMAYGGIKADCGSDGDDKLKAGEEKQASQAEEEQKQEAPTAQIDRLQLRKCFLFTEYCILRGANPFQRNLYDTMAMADVVRTYVHDAHRWQYLNLIAAIGSQPASQSAWRQKMLRKTRDKVLAVEIASAKSQIRSLQKEWPASRRVDTR